VKVLNRIKLEKGKTTQPTTSLHHKKCRISGKRQITFVDKRQRIPNNLPCQSRDGGMAYFFAPTLSKQLPLHLAARIRSKAA
jgi:hypothetical protein